MNALEVASQDGEKTRSARGRPWPWIALAMVVLGAFALRAYDLSRIFYELDESDFFNERIYGNPPKSLIDYAILTKASTTHTWGWPAIVWTACHFLGRTLPVARIPSVLIGTAAVLLIFRLVYGLLRSESARLKINPFIPAFFAALLTALSMPQMNFSQHTYPYAPTPFMAAAILLAHIELVREASANQQSRRGVILAAMAYTFTGAVALCIHLSLALLLAASLLVLAIPLVRYIIGRPQQERIGLLLLAVGMGAVFAGAALVNWKDTATGFRTYLVPYYHAPYLRFVPKLVLHTYDLATYHLNLFYNTSLYWPERLNPVLLPLVILCGLGFWMALAGKFGALARHLALVAISAIAITAGLSMVRRFPYGGLRQTLFLSPLLFAFTALGFYSLRHSTALKSLAAAAALSYFALWAVNLPRFYRERIDNSQDIARVWGENGKLPIYGWSINDRVLEYYAHRYPNMKIATPGELLWPEKHLPEARQPFLMIAPPRPLSVRSSFGDYLRQAGFTVTVLDDKSGIHPESDLYKTCLYYPPNGFWFYKVTPAE